MVFANCSGFDHANLAQMPGFTCYIFKVLLMSKLSKFGLYVKFAFIIKKSTTEPVLKNHVVTKRDMETLRSPGDISASIPHVVS